MKWNEWIMPAEEVRKIYLKRLNKAGKKPSNEGRPYFRGVNTGKGGGTEARMVGQTGGTEMRLIMGIALCLLVLSGCGDWKGGWRAAKFDGQLFLCRAVYLDGSLSHYECTSEIPQIKDWND